MSSAKVLLGLFIIYLLLPSVDILKIQSGHIRYSDLVTLLALCFIAPKIWVFRRAPFFLRIYFLYILVQCTSIVINFSELPVSSLLFPIRLLQYLVWFYVGLYLSRHIPEHTFFLVIRYLTIFLCIWGVAEYLALTPKFGAFSVVDDRISVNTNGPYEFAVVISFMMIYQSRVVAFIYPVLLMTSARITIASFSIWYLYKRFGLIKSLFLSVSFLAVALLLSQYFLDFLLQTRFAPLILGENPFAVGYEYFSNAFPVDSSEEYFFKTHFNGADYLGATGLSLEMRFLRWSTICATVFNECYSFLIGRGPGFFGTAADGHFIRVLGETGVIGLTLFVTFLGYFFRWCATNSKLLGCLLVMTLSAVFIDIFVSSKVMSLLWVFVGHHYYSQYIATRIYD